MNVSMLKRIALQGKHDRNDCRGLQIKHYNMWITGKSTEENAVAEIRQ